MRLIIFAALILITTIFHVEAAIDLEADYYGGRTNSQSRQFYRPSAAAPSATPANARRNLNEEPRQERSWSLLATMQNQGHRLKSHHVILPTHDCEPCPRGYVRNMGEALLCRCSPVVPFLPPPVLKCPPGYIELSDRCARMVTEPPPPPSVPHVTCQPGFMLIAGKCEYIPPPAKTCGSGYFLIHGRCEPIHVNRPLECPNGYTEVAGRCVQTLPFSCGPGLLLIGGRCEVISPPPTVASCRAGFMLVAGRCELNHSWDVPERRYCPGCYCQGTNCPCDTCNRQDYRGR